LLARTAFRVHADGAFCARVRAAYEAAPTAAAGASQNSAPLRYVDAGGGTDSADAKLMVRGRGPGPSH
jgi:hypothetical protein